MSMCLCESDTEEEPSARIEETRINAEISI
jgi:hypothetical protein